jgi:LysM repeat protein
VKNLLRILSVIAALLAIFHGQDAEAKGSHVVTSGESLWKISRNYGCGVEELRRANNLPGSLIQVGQELLIPSCSPEAKHLAKLVGETPAPLAKAPSAELVSHVVVAGDTLGALAKRHRTSVLDIQTRNGLSDHRIFVGQELEIKPNARTTQLPLRVLRGQSMGSPNSGSLLHATRLPQHPAYFIRRPERAFGAAHTVDQVRRVAIAIKRKFPRLHKLAVGDLSVKRGGKITMHSSHQSGRDVDLGFYFKKRPAGYPQEFVVATSSNIHFKATWEMITRLAQTAEERGGVEKMFLNYKTQRMLYKMAHKRGIPKQTLERIFQYPRGIGTHEGLIRHEPGHDEHIHVRFKCPKNDSGCR